MEMDKILTQQGVYYKELKDNKEQLLKMLTSKIPYYVGPLNNLFFGFCFFVWLTFWVGIEKVLPKESLLYQRYMLLEELSQIRIDGKKLSKEDRKAIIDDLFIGKGRVKVSDKDFKEYLNKVNYVNDWAVRLKEELGRKPSVKEVAERMGVSEDIVREAVSLSAEAIEDISDAKTNKDNDK